MHTNDDREIGHYQSSLYLYILACSHSIAVSSVGI